MDKSKTFQRVTLEKLISNKLANSKLLGNFLSELPEETNLNDITITLKYTPKERKLETWKPTQDGATRQVVDNVTSETRRKVDKNLKGQRLSRTVDKQGRRILYVER